jgi:hypothetical protein
MHCYDSGGLLGREARELAEIGGDAAKVFSWMEAKKDPCMLIRFTHSTETIGEQCGIV